MSRNKNKALVILATGGTGGHIFPAQAIAEKLNDNYRIHLVTDTRGEKFVKDILADIPRTTLKIRAISGSLIAKISSLLNLILATIYAYFKFLKMRPNLVVGFGGYPSFPAVASATLLNIPVILHEQNASMGAVNKLFAPFVKSVALSFENTSNVPQKAQSKVIYTGNPVRESIALLSKKATINKKKKSANRFSILVTGGSQGAAILSDIIPKAIGKLDQDTQSKIQIYHQVRENLQQGVEALYQKTHCTFDIKSFYNDIDKLMHSCDLIIGRAGATTIAEIIALAKPSILVPFKAASNNHQFYNAEALVNNGSALLMLEKDFNELNLSTKLSSLINNPDQISAMQNQAEKIKSSEAVDKLYLLIKKIINK